MQKRLNERAAAQAAMLRPPIPPPMGQPPMQLFAPGYAPYPMYPQQQYGPPRGQQQYGPPRDQQQPYPPPQQY